VDGEAGGRLDLIGPPTQGRPIPAAAKPSRPLRPPAASAAEPADGEAKDPLLPAALLTTWPDGHAKDAGAFLAVDGQASTFRNVCQALTTMPQTRYRPPMARGTRPE
jgi:hypothetical protein